MPYHTDCFCYDVDGFVEKYGTATGLCSVIQQVYTVLGTVHSVGTVLIS